MGDATPVSDAIGAKQFDVKFSQPRDGYRSADAQERVHGLGEKTIKREEGRDEQVRSRPIVENARRADFAHECRKREVENTPHDLQAWNSRFDNEKNKMRQDLEAAQATVSQLQSQLAAALQSNTGLRDQMKSEQRRTFVYEKERIATSIETEDLRVESRKWRNLLKDEQRRAFMYEKEIIATGIETKDLRAKNHQLEQQMRQLADEVSAYRRDAFIRDKRELRLARSFEHAKEQSLHRIRKLKTGHLCAMEGKATHT
ncbi:hypothetical protein BDV97DRAFT_403232 [Delphinella strobiligena]|nr:hypothetical protein BDV97DRAFT_403232 [Delphinella strobiligena]